jgi:ubiquinone/menaquinone biosynthesis C-methylase UbiE
MLNSDAAFTGSLPEVYDSNLGPLLFSPFAEDLAERASPLHATRILEIAAGTGVATSALAKRLPQAEIWATDLNAAMVAVAEARRPLPGVHWSVADATSLPFDDVDFDLVACQFGVMFFPDRLQAFRETRRVLTPDGTFLFNVWDAIEHNDMPKIVSSTIKAAFPHDPPTFIERTPHGHGDPAPIVRDLRDAGFNRITYEVVTLRSRAESARHAAVGFCEGTPLRNEITARNAKPLAEIVDALTRELENEFGFGAIEGSLRAYVYTAQ